MNEYSQQWSLEMALEVIHSSTVDAKTWADAVTWLMLHGPPELKELLSQASGHATSKCFPELKPAGFNHDGDVCYDLGSLALTVGESEEDIMARLKQIEETEGAQQLYEASEAKKIQ